VFHYAAFTPAQLVARNLLRWCKRGIRVAAISFQTVADWQKSKLPSLINPGMVVSGHEEMKFGEGLLFFVSQ